MIFQSDRIKTFPLIDFQKKPSVLWKDYNDNDFKEKTLTYGINCLKSNLVVIDLDNHQEGINGIIEWMKITADEDVPETFSVITPNNGIHYYFLDTTNGRIKNSTNKLANGIDVRANGGYVVGPGSKIKVNGIIEEYIIQDNVEIAPLPKFLEKALLEDIASDKIVEYSQSGVNVENEIQLSITSLFSTNVGSRNESLNKESYRLGRLGIDFQSVSSRLLYAAKAIGLEDEEINNTIKSGFEAGLREFQKNIVETNQPPKSPLDSPSGYFSDSVMMYRVKSVLLEERYRFIDAQNQWVKYNASIGIWENIPYNDVIARITKWCYDEVKKTADTKDADMIKASMRCLNKSTVINIAVLVKAQCLIEAKKFDNFPDYIVVENGVVDLKKLKIMPFDPNLYITKRIDLPWDKNIESKYLDKILDALPDDTKDWFLVMAGQSLTGRTPSSDTVFFLKGNGSNGKSTVLNLMTATAGTYGGLPPQASLIRTKNADDFNMSSYKNIHQAIIEEMPDKQLDVVKMKQLTGTDTITARELYKNNETFKLKCSVWISCNILPQVIEYDHGTWRRIVLIEFNKTYKKSPKDIIDKNDRLSDDSVRNAALHDRNTHIAFLNKRILGAHEWYKNHMSDPALPQSIIDSTINWKLKGDNIRSWFNETLIKDTGHFILNEDLRESYNHWLTEHGYAPVSHKVFLDRLENHDIFKENELTLVKSGKIGKLEQSLWHDPKQNNNSNYVPRKSGTASSHVKFIKFDV